MSLPAAGRSRVGPSQCGDVRGRRTPGWRGYMGVPDVDAATERPRQGGGTVAPRTGRHSGRRPLQPGRRPAGRRLLLFTPNGDMTTARPRRNAGPCRLARTLYDRLAVGVRFYADQFGWTKARPSTWARWASTSSSPPATRDRRHDEQARDPPDRGLELLLRGRRHRRCDQAAQRRRRTRRPWPHEVPGGSWIVQAMDPQGVPFALVAPRR